MARVYEGHPPGLAASWGRLTIDLPRHRVRRRGMGWKTYTCPSCSSARRRRLPLRCCSASRSAAPEPAGLRGVTRTFLQYRASFVTNPTGRATRARPYSYLTQMLGLSCRTPPAAADGGPDRVHPWPGAQERADDRQLLVDLTRAPSTSCCASLVLALVLVSQGVVRRCLLIRQSARRAHGRRRRQAGDRQVLALGPAASRSPSSTWGRTRRILQRQRRPPYGTRRR